MPLHLTRIDYRNLNARQKENYNFLKVSAVLADYGFMTMRLSADWQGADFIAQHIDGKRFMKVQLKSRLAIYKKYEGKDIWIAFPDGRDWYLCPHDEIVPPLLRAGVAATESWSKRGGYSFPGLDKFRRKLLEPYRIGRPTDNVAD